MDTDAVQSSTRSDLLFAVVVTVAIYVVAGPVAAAVAAVALVLLTTGVRAPLAALRDAALSAWRMLPSVGSLRGRSLSLRWAVVVFLAGVIIGRGGVALPEIRWPSIDWPIVLPDILPAPKPKATSATYVYEKDDHSVPGYVLSAFDSLNREGVVVATLLEADTKDGTGDVPDQYKAALSAAKDEGLPALVVTAGDEVISIVKDARDEQSVLDAVKL